FFHRVVVADVEGARCRAAAVVADLGDHPVELVRAPAGDDHVRPEARELVRRAAADARTSTGDDHVHVLEKARLENGLVAHGNLGKDYPAGKTSARSSISVS